jgi:hypothetical protein
MELGEVKAVAREAAKVLLARSEAALQKACVRHVAMGVSRCAEVIGDLKRDAHLPAMANSASEGFDCGEVITRP